MLGQVCRWSRLERSSWSLAQVSPAAASGLTEEVWEEGALKKRLESGTPPPSYAAVCNAVGGRWGPRATPLDPDALSAPFLLYYGAATCGGEVEFGRNLP